MSVLGLRPVLDASPAGQPALVPLRIGLVEAIEGGRVLGYIELVGDVFVILHGPRYDIAVEIAQSLRFERAVEILTAAASREQGGGELAAPPSSQLLPDGVRGAQP